MARRCKNGLRRDGKTCRKTKCRTYITQKGFCAKAGGWYAGTTRRRKTKKRSKRSSGYRRGPSEMEKLRQIAAWQLGYRKTPPLIGDDPVSRSNYGRGDPEVIGRYVERLRAGWGSRVPAPAVNYPPITIYPPGHTGTLEAFSAPARRRRGADPRQGGLF